MRRSSASRCGTRNRRAAASRRVGVLGLGTLAAVLDTLRRFGFPCAGWSRTPRSLDGIECYAGDAALDAFLARTDILICLLPLTDSTRGLLGARVFDALPAGASLVQVGRGPQLDEARCSRRSRAAASTARSST